MEKSSNTANFLEKNFSVFLMKAFQDEVVMFHVEKQQFLTMFEIVDQNELERN